MRQVLGPGALGRPRGSGWRGRCGGGGIGMGNTCKSMADSFQCMTKPTTIKKKKKKQHVKKDNGEFLATFHLYFPLDPFTFKIL